MTARMRPLPSLSLHGPRLGSKASQAEHGGGREDGSRRQHAHDAMMRLSELAVLATCSTRAPTSSWRPSSGRWPRALRPRREGSESVPGTMESPSVPAACRPSCEDQVSTLPFRTSDECIVTCTVAGCFMGTVPDERTRQYGVTITRTYVRIQCTSPSHTHTHKCTQSQPLAEMKPGSGVTSWRDPPARPEKGVRQRERRPLIGAGAAAGAWHDVEADEACVRPTPPPSWLPRTLRPRTDGARDAQASEQTRRPVTRARR